MAAEDWIAQIAAGDREAFRAVYEKYGKLVYQRALEQTGSKEQAQDVLKNVFRKLFHQLQDSASDPVLFLLEGLTDLETGFSGGAEAKTSGQPAAEQPQEAPSQPESAAAGTEPVAAPGAEPATAPAEQPASFDQAAAVLQGEYEQTALSPEDLQSLAGAPAAPAAASATQAPPKPTVAAPENYEEPQPMTVVSDDGNPVPPKKHRGLTAVLIILLVLLVLLTLWFGAGVLMMYSIIPSVDLGYGWFNQHLFNLFRF